jgi:hypothetical protein
MQRYAHKRLKVPPARSEARAEGQELKLVGSSYELRFNARFSTVSSAAFTSA